MTKKSISLIVVLCFALTFVAFSGGPRLFADALAINNAPSLMNYQGYLTDGSGQPFDGEAFLMFEIYDASTGGNAVWGEKHADVPIANGHFALNLGSLTPLESQFFSDSSRYIEVQVDLSNTGSNATPLPRQQLTSAPYAFVADRAMSVGWSGITNVPAGFADGLDAGDYQYVVTVAKNGGDYTSITAALASIAPSATEKYLIQVMPGVYTEHVVIPTYVHVRGSGCGVTEITSDSSGDWFSEEAATVAMTADSQLSEITVRNTSTTDGASAVRINQGNANSRLFNVKMYTTDAGGERHVGLYVRSSSDVMVDHVYAEASGATIFNHGANGGSGTYDSATFVASGDSGGSGTARGLEVGNDTIIRNSEMRASNASSAIAAYATGSTADLLRIDHSVLDGETTGIHSSNSQTVYIGASMVEGGAFAFSGIMRCVHSYTGSYVDVSAACN